MAEWSKEILTLINSSGVNAYLLFALLQVASCLLLLPGGFLTLAAGGIFGIIRGSLIVFAATNIGAALAFLFARYFCFNFAEKILESHPRLSRIERALSKRGARAVVLIRLCPIFPFRLTNFALGASHLRFPSFIAGTLLGTAPSSLTYVALGSLGGKLASAAEKGRMHFWLTASVVIIGALALLLLVRLISKAAEEELAAEGVSAEPSGVAA